MPIWVDADACPKVIKEILYRAADREKVVITFVANQRLSIPASPYLRTLQVLMWLIMKLYNVQTKMIW